MVWILEVKVDSVPFGPGLSFGFIGYLCRHLFEISYTDGIGFLRRANINLFSFNTGENIADIGWPPHISSF